MSQFRFAIISAAHIAEKFVDAVSQISEAEICAIASRSLERARAFAQANQIPAYYDSYERMLEEEKPDCVYIASVTSEHARLTELCIAHGIPVLCEKAMFTCASDARHVLGLAERAGVFVMEAMWSRFLPALREAKHQIDAGVIGDVVHIDACIGFHAPENPDNRYFSPALGGGAAYDLSVYCYELITWLMGEKPAHRHAMAVPGVTGVDVTEHVSMQFAGGVTAGFTCSLAAVMQEHLTINGTKGRLVLPRPHCGRKVLLYTDRGETPASVWEDQETKNGFVYEIREAMACIRAGKLESVVVPHADTLDCAELFDEIMASMKA